MSFSGNKIVEEPWYLWVKMSDFNNSGKTGRALPLNLRPYVTQSFSAFSIERNEVSSDKISREVIH